MDEKVQQEMNSLAQEHIDNFKELSEIEGMIVRGHILVEHALNRAISLSIKNKDEYKASRFTFSHKIILGAMLGVTYKLEDEITCLNKLRNQIAHSLKYDEKYIDIIINGITKKYPLLEQVEPLSRKLGMSITFICGAISMSPHVR